MIILDTGGDICSCQPAPAHLELSQREEACPGCAATGRVCDLFEWISHYVPIYELACKFCGHVVSVHCD